MSCNPGFEPADGAGTDPGSTVYACVDNDKGTVRVVSGSTKPIDSENPWTE